jgi:phage/plasmid-associated DNA primase
LNGGVVKELSSGLDPVACRGLHKQMIEFLPSFKIFLVVNTMPKVDPNDPALFIRLRIAHFLSQFLPKDQVPEDVAEQRKQRRYPINPHFEKKVQSFIAPFMWLLTERYKIVGRTGPVDPPEIMAMMKEFQLKNDVFLRFLTDMTEDCEGDGAVDADTLYTDFRDWFTRRHPKTTVLSQDNLVAYMTRKHGAPEWGTTWRGLRLRPKIQRVQRT